LSNVQVIDLLGTGTACLVWSSPLPAGVAGPPLRYVDLMGGMKPHLLTLVRNNLGSETRITYAPSTQFYVADKNRGPSVGHAAALPGAGSRARRDLRLDRPQPAGDALHLPSRLFRRLRARVPRIRPGRSVGHRRISHRHLLPRRRAAQLGGAILDAAHAHAHLVSHRRVRGGHSRFAAVCLGEYWIEPALTRSESLAYAAARTPCFRPEQILSRRARPTAR
jgi:hypothetical protein